MKLGELHHVGIAVPSVERALPFYRDTLGLRSDGDAMDIDDQAVRVCTLRGPVGIIELIAPLDDASGVARFLAARQGRAVLHHVCFVADDLRAVLGELAAGGVELIDAEPRRGAMGEVAFLHPRAGDGVLVELIDRGSLHTERA